MDVDLHRAWLRAKAKADRLYWQLHGERINAQRRQRYAQDAEYRQKQQDRARRQRHKKPSGQTKGDEHLTK